MLERRQINRIKNMKTKILLLIFMMCMIICSAQKPEKRTLTNKHVEVMNNKIVKVRMQNHRAIGLKPIKAGHTTLKLKKTSKLQNTNIIRSGVLSANGKILQRSNQFISKAFHSITPVKTKKINWQ